MFLRETSDALTHRPNVVGIVDSPRALSIAQTLDPDDVDILELRVDMFSSGQDKLLKGIKELSHPLLVTVRHPQEGGANSLTAAARRELFSGFLPYASLVDIELRSLESLGDIISKARAQGVKLVYSYHNFQSTPSHARLFELARRALLAEADVCKLAVLTNTPVDLALLLTFLSKQKRIHLSLMGMGKFGKISRLALAQAGSVLNYGYLEKPNVTGQWSARELKARISELISA